MEPLAALAAVVVVGLTLAVYADVLAAVEPSPSDPATASATLQRVHNRLADGSVAVPDRLSRLGDVAPPGSHLNVTLETDDQRWTVGPAPPETARRATRPTPVRVDRWHATAGRLRVVVWS